MGWGLFEIGVVVGVDMKEKTVEEMEVVNDGLDAVERELMGLEVLVV